jgi:hypothetical protein
MDPGHTDGRGKEDSMELATLRTAGTHDQERRSSSDPSREWLLNQMASLDEVSQFPHDQRYSQQQETNSPPRQSNQSYTATASLDISRGSSPSRFVVQEEQPLQHVYQTGSLPTTHAPSRPSADSHSRSVTSTVARAALDLCIALTPLYFLIFAILAFAYRGSSVTTGVSDTLLRTAGYVR